MNSDDQNIFFGGVITSFDFIKFLLNEQNIKQLTPGTFLDLYVVRVKNVLFPNVCIPISTVNKEEIDVFTDAYTNSKLIGIVGFDSENDNFYNVGTTARILKLIKLTDGRVQLILQGIDRFRIQKTEVDGVLVNSNVEIIGDTNIEESNSDQVRAICSSIKEILAKLVDYQNLPVEVKFFIEQNNNLNLLIYLIASCINLDNSKKQQILEETDLLKRGSLLVDFLNRELEFSSIKNKKIKKTREKLDNRQKELFLRQQLDTIEGELSNLGFSSDDDDIGKLRAKASKKKFSKATKEFVNKLLKKAKKITPNSADYMILINQAEFILDLPWNNYKEESSEIENARSILNENHFGMDKVKERILEYLSIYKLKNNTISGDILCLIGPPGVGKTSLCRSIAKALNREYVKVSLGGIDDEAEIRGHRKTYIGAMSGRILKGLQHLKTSNPVFVLDEIDKMTKFQGDPAAALLEVLDPDQNKEFVDHYVETPYDLSKIMFIATANDYSSIPLALRDRLEIIDVSGYAVEEKIQIAKDYIIPELIENNGLKSSDISIADDCIVKIIENYTRESGVRELKRQLNSLLRKICCRIVEKKDYDKVLTAENLCKYLGIIKYDNDRSKKLVKPGVAIGLAWTPVGGDILFLEAVKMKGKGKLTLSGSLGDVMKESANLAFIYLKSNMKEFNLSSDMFEKNDFHIHVPDGATPKDGPSAGITLFSTLLSLLSNKVIKNSLAMTGEITLRGDVTAVGGIKEKVLAAKRSGIKTIIMCKDNKKDVSEIKKDYITGVKFIYISKIGELTKYIF